MSAENQNSKVGKAYLSNDTKAKIIEEWASGKTPITELASLFYLTEEQVLKIIYTDYKPALTGELMTLTIPSKLNLIN